MNTIPRNIAAVQLVLVLATLGTGPVAYAAQAPGSQPPNGPAASQRASEAATSQAPVQTPGGLPAPGSPSGAPEAPAPPGTPPRVVGVRVQAPRASPTRAHRRVVRSASKRSPRAHSAASASVTIKDFSFGPSTVTVHAGDTVTWVNEGPSNHTASAAGFNTGILHSGQSASQTFTHAGTFSYRCSIHPFMRGVVIVLPAPASTGASPSSGSAATGGPGASAATTQPAGSGATQGPTLPATGFDARREIVAGLAMLALGGTLLAAAGATRRIRAGRHTPMPKHRALGRGSSKLR